MANVVDAPVAQVHLSSSSSPAAPHSSSDGGRQHSSGGNNSVTYGKTWAEDVQNYHAAKSVLPWLPQQHKPVQHVTRYDKSREEREYDVVLGRFRDEEKELGYQQREDNELKRNLEKGRAKQLRTVQRFHLINNSPMYPGAKDPTDKQPVAHPYRKKSAAEYNIVTNLPHNGSSALAPATGGSPSRKSYREFNILTNKYHDRHEDRSEEDAAQAKYVAAQKYFKTRSFDPIRITYVDEEREKEFLIRRQEEQQIHGKDRVLVLPPREQFSEGRLYNILNQRVINSAKLATMNEKDQRTLNKIKKTAFEAKMREVGENERTQEIDRCLNRYAHERHVESHVHGYDVLSNQPYVGRDAKSIAHPRTHAALPAWQTIETGLLVSNRVAPKSLSTSAVVPSTRPPSNPQVVRDSHSAVEKSDIFVVAQSSGTIQPSSNLASPHSSHATIRTGGFRAE